MRNIIEFSEALGVIESMGMTYECLGDGEIKLMAGGRHVILPPHCPTRKTGYSRRKIGNARVTLMGRERKFMVLFTPRHSHSRLQASTDRGVTVTVVARSEKLAIAEAKRQGVHKQGDYPKGMTFDWVAEEV